MDKDIIRQLEIPSELEGIVLNSLYELSVDDGKNNIIRIKTQWEYNRFIEAGFIRDSEEKTISFPYDANQHVVFMDEMAIDMDNIAASISCTENKNRFFKLNVARSTVDALFISEKKEWYLIEFKNGDWKEKEIKGKVYDTIAVLKMLDVLDNDAYFTTNRDADSVHVTNFKLTEKLGEVFGYDGTEKFIKNNIQLMVVYTDKMQKESAFLKLCDRRKEFQEIDKILSNGNVFSNCHLKAKVNMGYTNLSILATYLLEADSYNKYFMLYRNVCKYIDRIKQITNEPAQIVDKRLYEYLSQKMSREIDNNCQIITWADFKKMMARHSIRYAKDEEMFECNDDEYDRVCKIFHGLYLNDKEIMKFQKSISDLQQKLLLLFPKSEQQEEIGLMTNSNFLKYSLDVEQTIGKILLHERVIKKNGYHTINIQQKKLLLQNVMKISEQESDRVLMIIEEDMILLTQYVAFKCYFEKKYHVFQDFEEDQYMHFIRQIYYLEELYKTESFGKSKVATYGIFRPYLEMLNLSPDKMYETVKKIEMKILQGKSKEEILSLHIGVFHCMDSNDIKIEKLKNIFEKTELKAVLGCKGEDLRKHLIGTSE